MWTLFDGFWSAPPTPVSVRNQALLDRLVEWHSVADGGFVGARDRSVRQIAMEQDLFRQTRSEARALKPSYGEDRAAFASALPAGHTTTRGDGNRACAAIFLAWQRCRIAQSWPIRSRSSSVG